MTPTLFVIVLGCIGFVTGLMGFSEDIAKHPKFKFVDTLPTKIIILLIATVGTIYATSLYNRRTDQDNDAKLAKQDSIATARLNYRDSINRQHLDSVNNNTVEILAKYGYKVDSANNAIIRKMDTSMGKAIPNLSVFTDETANDKFKLDGDKFQYPLGLIDDGNSIAYDVHFYYTTILKIQNEYKSLPARPFYADQKINIGIGEQITGTNKITFDNPLVNRDTIFLLLDFDYMDALKKKYSSSKVYSVYPQANYIGIYNFGMNAKLSQLLKQINFKNK